jgi:hypothetical protein
MGAGRKRDTARANLGAGFLARMAVLGCVAIVGAAWGLVRFYTRVKEPLTLPAARDAGGWDAGAGTVEIEVEGR